MPRRVSLPGAEELFRRTRSRAPEDSAADQLERRSGSGRVKHDEKMTVYISAEELMALEHARLALRRELGAGVDRGRVVREAVAIALADLDERGSESDLVRRLARP